MLGDLRDLSDAELWAEYQRWRLIEHRVKKGQMRSWELDRMNEVSKEVRERQMPFSPEPPETYLKD